MRAIYVSQGGAADVLQLGEMTQPIPAPGQILVRVKAVGVNPIDCKIRATPERFPVSLPFIPGCDAAGIVEAVTEEVNGFEEGDEVYFSQPGFSPLQGSYAEFVAVDAALVAPKPKSLTFAQAAAAPLVLITAWEALHDRARIQPGQRIVVHAGAGGVGHVAVQLAKLADTKVLATISSEEKAGFVEQLGADQTVNYKKEDVNSRVMEWSDNQGVDVVLDTVGGDVLQDCFTYVKPYGDVVTILQPNSDINWSEARKRNLRFSFELMLSPVMLNIATAKRHQGRILAQCTELFDQQRLHIKVAQTFPLEDAVVAQQYLEQQHPAGKVVIVID